MTNDSTPAVPATSERCAYRFKKKMVGREIGDVCGISREYHDDSAHPFVAAPAASEAPADPMPVEERYLSQRAAKAAENAFGAVKIRKAEAPADDLVNRARTFGASGRARKIMMELADEIGRLRREPTITREQFEDAKDAEIASLRDLIERLEAKAQAYRFVNNGVEAALLREASNALSPQLELRSKIRTTHE